MSSLPPVASSSPWSPYTSSVQWGNTTVSTDVRQQLWVPARQSVPPAVSSSLLLVKAFCELHVAATRLREAWEG